MDRPVLSVAEAVEQHGVQSVFVIGIWHSSAAQRQLAELGCRAFVTAVTFCRHFGPPLTPLASIDYPTAIYNHTADLEACANNWSDEKSRDEYFKVLRWFLAESEETIVDHDPAIETYFPEGLWTTNDQEHFVDCGAFDGDSVLYLLRKSEFQFKAVTAFEPDPGNFEKLQNNVAQLSEKDREKIRVVNAAVGASPSVLNFSVLGSAGSSVADDGVFTVKCVTLDEELRDRPPTFLKMDIEGYELEALAGARSVIALHAPILAITTYHKIEHLWQIPLLVKSFRPDYRLYLRRYAEDCWETVCYAVPPSRSHC